MSIRACSPSLKTPSSTTTSATHPFRFPTNIRKRVSGRSPSPSAYPTDQSPKSSPVSKKATRWYCSSKLAEFRAEASFSKQQVRNLQLVLSRIPGSNRDFHAPASRARQRMRPVWYLLFMATKIKRIGILTAGGDSPGLNAAIRGVGKAALGSYGMEIVGFRDGFRGLVENRRLNLDRATLSGILTVGGTILGTSRDKPHRMEIDGKTKDMTGVIKDNLKKWGVECVVCLGGGGTQKSALRLYKAGINVITLPKTIDNDVAMTDSTFGYATALDIATEAIDRLHSTAHSH